MESLRFIDLFAGMGGFHAALTSLGHECVFASEIDEELRTLYSINFPKMRGKVHGDIRESKNLVPDHDLLCAGFPCQPFSKSGGQLGTRDETRGTLFHEILDILERVRPRYVLLENVGNFGRHDGGNTWKIVRNRLKLLGYNVEGTEHLTPISSVDWRDVGAQVQSGLTKPGGSNAEHLPGCGLISPHHFGHPHHRERFFIVASLGQLPSPVFPSGVRDAKTSLRSIEQKEKELSDDDKRETKLTIQQIECINHWNEFLNALPADFEIPSFPLWGDEIKANYPYEETTPWGSSAGILGKTFIPPFPAYSRKDRMLAMLPSYAQEEVKKFRNWKIRFIRKNRTWWRQAEEFLTDEWLARLQNFPPSLRKLEWNAKGEDRNIWAHVMQFRPSGLRVKRYSASPALVAMTSTQIPILGPRKRFISRIEGLRLQGFSDAHLLPKSRDAAFRALGNGVHVDVVRRIAQNLLSCDSEAFQYAPSVKKMCRA